MNDIKKLEGHLQRKVTTSARMDEHYSGISISRFQLKLHEYRGTIIMLCTIPSLFSLFISLTTTIITADFQDQLLLTAPEWKAIYVVGDLLVGTVLIVIFSYGVVKWKKGQYFNEEKFVEWMKTDDSEGPTSKQHRRK